MAAITFNLVDRTFIRKKIATQNIAGLLFFLSFIGFSISNSFTATSYMAVILIYFVVISVTILIISLFIPSNVRSVGRATLTEDKLETVISGIHNTYHLAQVRLQLAKHFLPDLADNKVSYFDETSAWNNFLLLPRGDAPDPIKIEFEPNEIIFDAKKLIKVTSYNKPSFLIENPKIWFEHLTSF